MLSLAATLAGIVLGTAAYMAPEQAKGRVADKRSDVWAFGCVLYEMLTGKRAFDGEDITEIIGAVVRLDPEWNALPSECPTAVRTLLKRCLEKDRRKRIADISTALFVLDEATSLSTMDDVGRVLPSGAAGSKEQDPAYARLAWRRVALFSTMALAIGAAAAGTLVWLATRPGPPRVERFSIDPSGPAAVAINGNDRDLAMTPDGTRIVYAGNNGTQLFVRALAQLDPTPLTTAGTVRAAFVAPDRQWVGFVENNTTLKKVAITGGPAVTLAQLDARRPARRLQLAAREPGQPVLAGSRWHRRGRAADGERQSAVPHGGLTGRHARRVPRTDSDDGARSDGRDARRRPPGAAACARIGRAWAAFARLRRARATSDERRRVAFARSARYASRRTSAG